ncbi:unnamed protein product, partial [Durusdinium trenchii]
MAPCEEGTSLLSLTCQPCRAGYYRREGMLHCQDCPSGYFQDLAGASGCLRCPPVSTSCDSSTLPKLEEGHFTFTDSYSFLSNNSGYPALRDFVFDFVGTFNLTNTNDVATAVSSTGLQACSESCYLSNECAGFSYNYVTQECWLMEDEVISLQRVEGPFYHYWRQSSLEELNLSSLSPALSGQFPVPNFGLEYAKCFVPKPCAGDTSCTTAYNFGLFCSQCIPGYSFDGVFPASRLCSKCPSSAVVCAASGDPPAHGPLYAGSGTIGHRRGEGFFKP